MSHTHRALRPDLAGGIAAAALSAVAGLALLGPNAPAAAAEWRRPRWQVFASEEGRFQVELPEPPRVESRRHSTLFGAVEETKFVLHLGDDVVVAVEVHDIPRLAARIVPASTILERARRGVLEDMDAEQVEASEVTLQGFPGRDFTYRVPADASLETARYERALAVLVGSRLYLVTALAPGSPGARPEIAHFFASFRFWRKGSPPPDTVLRAQPPRGGGHPGENDADS